MSEHSGHLSLFARKLGDETAPPLIILHGLLGTSDNWQSLGKRFAETHSVHVLDQRNHGRSPQYASHQYDDMASDLRAYMDTENLQTASILGHSMGGKTALQFAHEHPEQIDRLVIADMAARAYTPHHTPIFDALLTAPIAQAQSRGEVESHIMSQLQDPGMVAFLMKNLRREKSGGFTWRPNLPVLAASLDSVVGSVELNTNTLPTLLIYGGQSDYVGAADLQFFDERCLQLETHEIPEAGHWLHASHPDEFFEVVFDFLNGN